MINDSPECPCPIWGLHGPIMSNSIGEGCSDRAGGRYIITPEVSDTVRDCDDAHKARLTTMLIDQRRQGVELPEVTPQLVEDAKNKHPLSVYERAERLLQYFVSKTDRVGQSLRFNDDINNPIFQGAMAWSESIDSKQVLFLLRVPNKKR